MLKFSFSKIKTKAAAVLAIATMGVQLIAPAAASIGSVNAATNTNQTVTTNTFGNNKLISPTLAGSSVRSEAPLTFHMTGVNTKGYMRVDHHDGKAPEYMISEQFADQYNRIAYCMDSELPTPNGGSSNNTAEGNDQFLRMFLNGYPTKSASQLGTANDTEAWYATQAVSWVLAGDFKYTDIVWSTPEQTQDSVDRVHHAADIIYNAAINGTDTQKTTFDLQKVNQQDKNGFHEFTYQVNSNRSGIAQIKLNNTVAGLTIVDQNGQPIANNQVNLNQSFTIKVPVTAASGNVNFDVNGNVKNYKSLVFGDVATGFQRAITAFTTDETPVIKNASFNWQRAAGQIKVTKIDETTKKPLKNAEFTVTDNNGQKQVKTTDANGVATFNILQGLTYDLKETKTPTGYHGGFEQKGITLANNGQVFSYTVGNTLNKGTIKIHKVDQDGKALKGAEFTLTDNTGKKVVSITDNKGYAAFKLDANKTYSLDETKLPAGYHGGFHKDGITVANDGQTFEYSVSNILNRGTVKVHKVDQDGKVLKGAEFTLTDNNGKKTVATTDDKGYAAFNLEANKTYALDETKNPVGYNGSFHKAGITVTKDQQVFDYTAKNTLNKGTIKVLKVDQDGKTLKGAEFTLTDKDGKKVVKTTDDKGEADFEIVANNTYDLKETKNPTGYNGSFEQKDITIEKDGQTFNYKATNNLNKGQLKLAKVDENGNPVKGAEFTLTDNDGHKVTATTDDKGYAMFDLVANKTYALDETKTPAGYSGSFHQAGLSIKADGEVINLKAVNTKNKTLIKTGSQKSIGGLLMVVGLILLVIAGVFYFLKKKADRA
ncbi:SpaA isopeptide-forming pilin-related protein [Latilactobacillus fragifolii]|uniref:SpaA isopeptide-forming pilin-related protein n=1 Tax=Latilactobacillus fragifolii TaxID=2814244 RepID=UPI001ABB90B3|nr:SpaA isopeptide-forming pilin-related protein [Latilactobacillus fragifolii]